MKQGQRYSNASIPNLTMGVDLGDRRSRIYVVDAHGERTSEGWATTTREGLSQWFGRYPGARLVMEAGTHSPWVSRLSEESQHETFVANPSELYGRKRRKRRNDDLDAQKLGRLGRADPALLYPIRHRGEEAQVDLAVLRSRQSMRRALEPVVEQIAALTEAINGFDHRIEPDHDDSRPTLPRYPSNQSKLSRIRSLRRT